MQSGACDRSGQTEGSQIMVAGYQTTLCCSVAKSCPTPCDPIDQGPPTFTITQNLLRFMSIQSVMLSNHLILRCPLLLSPSVFPSIRSFPMSQLFASGSQSFEASASVLPMNNQDWFPLRLTGLISLLSKGLSRIFSSNTVWKHQFFRAQPSLWSNSYFYMTTGKITCLTIWIFAKCVCFLIHCLGLS